MAPTAARLRIASEGLRTTARRLDLDLGSVAARGDHQTWEGPAATGYRRAAVGIEARGAGVTDALRRLAWTLDQRADEVERAGALLDREQEAAARAREQSGRRPSPPSPAAPPPSFGEIVRGPSVPAAPPARETSWPGRVGGLRRG